jgi:hypothetical protein
MKIPRSTSPVTSVLCVHPCLHTNSANVSLPHNVNSAQPQRHLRQPIDNVGKRNAPCRTSYYTSCSSCVRHKVAMGGSRRNVSIGMYLQSTGLLQLIVLRHPHRLFRRGYTQLLTGAHQRVHISPVFCRLHWLSVHRRFE